MNTTPIAIKKKLALVFVLGIFVFFFIPKNSFANYIAPLGGGLTGGTCTAGPSVTVPMDECQAQKGSPDNFCQQSPWEFRYASGCTATYSGTGSTCVFDYQYTYNTCNTGDRCLGGATAGSGGPINPGYVAPGICDASILQ